MKTFALFVSILVGYLAARKIADSDKAGFSAAVSDAVEAVESEMGWNTEPAPELAPTTSPAPQAPRASFGTAYDSLIVSSAQSAGISPETLYRLLYEESRFRPDIISGATRSPVGAVGIAQFMPDTAVEWLGSVEAAMDPRKAIPGAARYLAWLERKTGSMVAAVAAYNWGIGNVQRKGLAKAPAETRQYVAAILPGQSLG